MAEEEHVKFPPKILKYFSLALAAFAITFYLFWMGYYLWLPGKRIFDVGVYALAVPLLLLGIGGAFLYSRLEKKARDELKSKQEKAQ